MKTKMMKTPKAEIVKLDEFITHCQQKLTEAEDRKETTKTGERCQRCEIATYKKFIFSLQEKRQKLASCLFSDSED